MNIFHMPIRFFAALLGRVLMHGIRYIKHACAAVNTEFVAFSILFRATVPTMLIALVIDNVVNMLLRAFAKNMRNFKAIEYLLTYRQDGEAVCLCNCFVLVGWVVHRFILFFFLIN